MPDEIITTDTPVPATAPVAEVAPSPEPEPAVVSVVESPAVIVEEPSVEVAQAQTPSSAEEVVAEPVVVSEAPLTTEVAPTAVEEQSVAPEQSVISVVEETPTASEPVDSIAVPAEPVVETLIQQTTAEPVVEVATLVAVVEPAQAPIQPTEIAPEPQALAPGGDLTSTPQTVQFEALRSENTPEILKVKPAIEQAHAAPEPTRTTPLQSMPEAAQRIISQNIFRSLIAKGRATIQSRKRKKLDHIMDLFIKQPSITNDDVEKLLHISDATACRYLGILEKENKIKRVGTTGQGVSYTKV